MNTYEYTLDPESIRRLSALVGGRWKCFGGSSMGADRMQPFDLFLATEQDVVTVNSSVDFHDILGEDYDTMIAELSVVADAIDLAGMAREGHTFVHHSGEPVVDVRIVRDTIDEHRDGEHTWKLVTDVGILVVLERGVIAVSQDSMHDEMMRVTIAESLNEVEIPAVQSRWQEKLGIVYVVGREMLSVALMGAETRSEGDR